MRTNNIAGVMAICIAGLIAFLAGNGPQGYLAAAQSGTVDPDSPTALTPTPIILFETPPILEPTPVSDLLDINKSFPPCYDTPLQLRPEDHFWLARPLPSNYRNQLNPDYRYGTDYNDEMNTHTGSDIPENMNVPIIASADGLVVWSGVGLFGHYPNPADPYGYAVSIKHDFGYLGKPVFTVYAHLSRTDVHTGDRVVKGQQVGLLGETGKASGPHLHYEVRVGEDSFFATRNPELWLVPPEGYGVLAGRIESVDYFVLTEFPILIRRMDNKREYPLLTYKFDLAHSDDIYNESFAINDLPAGTYQFDFWLWWRHYLFEVEVLPGMTTFVHIRSGDDPLINPPLTIPSLSP